MHAHMRARTHTHIHTIHKITQNPCSELGSTQNTKSKNKTHSLDGLAEQLGHLLDASGDGHVKVTVADVEHQSTADARVDLCVAAAVCRTMFGLVGVAHRVKIAQCECEHTHADRRRREREVSCHAHLCLDLKHLVLLDKALLHGRRW